MKPYKPISCTFVDLIEHYATLKRSVSIRFSENAGEKELVSMIETWYNDGTGEYLKLTEYELDIRFDQIISIDGHKLQNYC